MGIRGLNFILTPPAPPAERAPTLPLRVGASLKGVDRALPASLGVDRSAAAGGLAGAEAEAEAVVADDEPAAPVDEAVRAAETRFGLRAAGLDESAIVISDHALF